MKHQRADGDRLVHVAAMTEVADRPAVEASPHGLDLVDQLHGAHLRRAYQRTGREGRGKQVERVATRGEAAGDPADDVHDVAVALDGPERMHFDRSGLRDTAEIITREVHQHHVLGILLWIGQELGFELGVAERVGTARPRTGDRPQLRVTAVELDQCLGR